jgi:3-hydroxyisobutyrate dehydrogenase-like beta-hydroxyacid dehydrogenase
MGHGIGRNLMANGHALSVVAHRNRVSVEDLVTCGAREVRSPREAAAQSDIIITCVTGSPEFTQVADGPDGFMASLSAGQTVIDCTTGEPDIVIDYARRIAEVGARLTDCPLARTPVEAEAGKLNVMVGAEPEVFADMRPLLACFCENIFHVGPVGSGSRMKLINNLITMGQAALIAEAVAVCKATGVDLRVFYSIMSKGGGNSGIFQMVMTDLVENGSFDGLKFSIANAAKDLRYYNRMTGTAGLAAPMGALVHDRLVTARKLGFDDGLVGHLVAASLALNGLGEVGNAKPGDPISL